jgi:hypothetical protein
MRLANQFLGSYRDHEAVNSKLVLQSGDGNLLASGLCTNECTPEDEVMSESDSIDVTKFVDEDQAKPLIRPEVINFEYPMSLADFKRIRANPYGYIKHCSGKGHIFKIIYRPNEGKANFELRERYDNN